MNFKEWFKRSGLTKSGLAAIAKVDLGTIINLIIGKPPQYKTVSKLIRATRNMHPPITLEMFPATRGHRKFKRLKEKKNGQTI